MSAIEPDALDYDLVPPDPGLINPDLALDAALAPVENIENDSPVPFGRSWLFDFEVGQFVRDGTVPKTVYELDTLIMWCEKTLRTARLAHPIYSDTYGVENAETTAHIGMQLDPEMLTAMQDAMTDALLAHDRIISVENFEFDQDPFDEIVEVSFTVMVDAVPPLAPQAIDFTNVPLT